jgi:hypothetical protein
MGRCDCTSGERGSRLWERSGALVLVVLSGCAGIVGIADLPTPDDGGPDAMTEGGAGGDADGGNVVATTDAVSDVVADRDAGTLDGSTADVDASDADASDTDASDAEAPACDLTKPFGAPQLLPGAINSMHGAEYLWLSADQLTAFVSALDPAHPGRTSLFTGTRASADASFTSLSGMGTLNAVAAGGGPFSPILTNDGLTIYFGNGPFGSEHVWTATRASTTVDFSAPALVAAPVNQDGGGTGEDWPTWISPDGTTLYIVSNRAGGSGRDIWMSTRAGTGAFSVPTNVTELNSANIEQGVILTPDGLQAFLTRGPCGSAERIYYSKRPSVGAGFSSPVEITELNVADCESASWVTPDGCTIYFSGYSYADGGGSHSIYVATRGK